MKPLAELMPADILPYAELMWWTYKGPPVAGWSLVDRRGSDETGLDVSAFRPNDNADRRLVLCFEGAKPGRDRGDIKAIARSRLGGNYPIEDYNLVGALLAARASPRDEIIPVGHSRGCGQAAAIARHFGLGTVIAFEGGTMALRTKDAIDNANVLSVEMRGSPFGDSSKRKWGLFPRTPLKGRVMRLDPPARFKLGLRFHLMDAVLEAVREAAKGSAASAG